jgi:hypothetical protein
MAVDEDENMPQHEIEASLPAHRVVNTDVTIIVKSDGKRLGELLISKGTIDWRPTRKWRDTSTCKLSWERFDRVMREECG